MHLGYLALANHCPVYSSLMQLANSIAEFYTVRCRSLVSVGPPSESSQSQAKLHSLRSTSVSTPEASVKVAFKLTPANWATAPATPPKSPAPSHQTPVAHAPRPDQTHSPPPPHRHSPLHTPPAPPQPQHSTHPPAPKSPCRRSKPLHGYP